MNKSSKANIKIANSEAGRNELPRMTSTIKVGSCVVSYVVVILKSLFETYFRAF